MEKFKLRKTIDVGYLMAFLLASLQFSQALSSVFWDIKYTEAVITNVSFNMLKFEVITSVSNYDLDILPTYAVFLVLLIDLIYNAIAYIKHRIHANRKSET